jgi:two-component system, LytTR family, response regulator
MRTLIIDDEWLARSELQRLLSVHPEVEVVGEASNVEEAIEMIDSQEPDLLFLDIEMPGGSGFDLLETLDSVPDVVFTTAFDEHALKAFEVSALDYLVKPINPDRLAQSLAQARRRFQPGIVRHFGKGLTAGQKVFVRDGENCWFVAVEQIHLIEADGGYARIHFDDNKPLLNRSLNQLEAKLDPTLFFRANKSQIINLKAVRKIHPWLKRRLLVQLDDGTEVTLSRRRATAFQEQMGM